MRVGSTPVQEALGRLEEIGSRAAISARLERVFLLIRAHLIAYQGHFEAARGFSARATALADEYGLDSAHAHFVVGHVEVLAGDPAAAERELRTVCEHYEAASSTRPSASAVRR